MLVKRRYQFTSLAAPRLLHKFLAFPDLDFRTSGSGFPKRISYYVRSPSPLDPALTIQVCCFLKSLVLNCTENHINSRCHDSKLPDRTTTATQRPLNHPCVIKVEMPRVLTMDHVSSNGLKRHNPRLNCSLELGQLHQF